MALRRLWCQSLSVYPSRGRVNRLRGYLDRAEGGVSYFRYLPDNILLVKTHLRLLWEMIPHFPRLLGWSLFRRLRKSPLPYPRV
jgi:hypothetical protein